MNWSDIAKDVGKAAPIVGTILGGPLGGAVGTLVSTALGVDNSPDAVSAALAADPAAYEKLREAEINAKVQLQQMLVQQENNRLTFALQDFQNEAADRDSARKLAMAQPSDHTRQYITYSMIAFVVLVVIAMFTPVGVMLLKDSVACLAIGNVTGYLFNELKQILAFWFGATRDNSSQQAAITAFAVSPGSVTAAPQQTTTTVRTQTDPPQTVTVAPTSQNTPYQGS